MCRSQQVRDHLDRVEGFERDFHEKGVPVAHRAVPQAGKLQRLEFAALEALGADEASFGVHVFEQVELASPVVFQAADQVHRVEVRGTGHRRHRAGVLLVDLDALQDLERGGAVLAGDDVGAAAGLAFVADHAADADRAVELRAEHVHALRLAVRKRELDAEFLVQEVLDFIAELHGGGLVQLPEIAEDAVADLQGLPHQDLLEAGGRAEELLVRHIVDVLDGHQFRIDPVQVVDQGAVTGGTEQEGVVVGPEGSVLRVHRDGVGGLVLEGEGHVVLDPVPGLEGGTDLGERLLEKGLVLRGDGDDQVAGTVGVAHVGRRLHEVFGDGGADFAAGIPMEKDDSLGLVSVAEAGVGEDLRQDGAAVGGAVFDGAEAFRGVEGEFFYLGCEAGAGGIGREVLPFLEGSQTREDILEHAGGGPGGRDELAFPVDLRRFEIADGVISLLFGKDPDAALRRGGPHDLHPGKSFPEMVDLLFDAADGRSPLANLVDVFLAEHGFSVCYSM